ncbi:MAG: hypothetical protein M1482_15845 [Chloroflexi bacterium]|nr:hypothetical protein [Chloroflexota bacterium]
MALGRLKQGQRQPTQRELAESIRLRAIGESEALRLRGAGEADAIRATGSATADACRAGVESLGGQAYGLLQMMQVIGDRSVRIVPDVQVTGADGAAGIVEALLGTMVSRPSNGQTETK